MILSQDQIIEILKTLLPYVITLIIGGIGGWELLNKKIKAMKEFWDTVYNATYDNNVSDKEFEEIIEKGVAIFK